MTTSGRQVELLEKNRPRQARAKRTYEAILNAAAELLVEVGVERISTNLIAERADITVPALYRYFPNKYAVIYALGAQLMDSQNRAFQDWIETHGQGGDLVDLLSRVHDLLQSTVEVTASQHGGLEILQALRAVEPLRELRLTSHNLIAEQFTQILADILERPADAQLTRRARVSVDTGYNLVEMALEQPQDQVEGILNEGARMLQAYWLAFLDGTD